jgi:hypothetical protein
MRGIMLGGLAGAAIVCLYLAATKLLSELRRITLHLVACRALLKHIAEHMQRGSRVNVDRVFWDERLEDALRGAEVETDAAPAEEKSDHL